MERPVAARTSANTGARPGGAGGPAHGVEGRKGMHARLRRARPAGGPPALLVDEAAETLARTALAIALNARTGWVGPDEPLPGTLDPCVARRAAQMLRERTRPGPYLAHAIDVLARGAAVDLADETGSGADGPVSA